MRADGMEDRAVTPSVCAWRTRSSERKMGPSVEPAARRSGESHAEQRTGEGNAKLDTSERESVPYTRTDPDQAEVLRRD
jgi:hypothetical protein